MNCKPIYRGAFVILCITAALLLLAQSRNTVVAQTIVARPAPEFNQTDPLAWLNSPSSTSSTHR